MAKILGLTILSFLCASSAFADEATQRKQELAKLKNQTQKKEEELKKYREQEKKISKEISALQTKQAQAQRLKNKVEMDISVVEQNLISIEDKRAALQRSMPMWQGVTWEEIQKFYFTPTCQACPNSDIALDIFMDRMLTHKAAFAVALQRENKEAQHSFEAFTERNKKLQAQSTQLKKEQAVISQSFQKRKQDLDVTKRKVDAVRREINELNKSATELNNLLASFERKRQETAKKNAGSGTKVAGPKINIPPHSLPWPVQGKVISQFGKEYRPDLNTWIFRDGIKIAAAYGATVRTCSAGSVIYAGPFRSYGNVVIMDHGKGFFSIYGFLKDILVSVGDKLETQGAVGTVGRDTQSSSGTGQNAIYFEIRQGTTAVDPLDWLK